jgi:chemotaxis family two-component system response regulator PixG
MKTCEVFTTDELAEQIFFCAKERFTGQLDVAVEEHPGKHWSLYFSEGFIWGGCGVHPMRSWYRQLSRHCPQLVVEPAGQEPVQLLCKDYNSLAELVKQGKVPQEQAVELVENQVIEILFDIIQQREQLLPAHLELQLTYGPDAKYLRDSTFATIQTDQIWWQARKYWEAWQEEDLVECSPNSAPIILRPEELQRHTSKLVYDNLTALGNGNWTLRDLAVKLNRSLLRLTKPIVPYVHDGLMRLIEIKDLYEQKLDSSNSTYKSPDRAPVGDMDSSPELERAGYLVACIDDSQVDTQIMNHILTQAGYQFINIHNQEKALPTMLLHKPDLIFLDLVMPIVNGYEICAQIRRIPLFKYTPVIFVTGKNGITDRARAKLVGSSDFIAKPINREKVLKVLQTYLPIAPLV